MLPWYCAATTIILKYSNSYSNIITKILVLLALHVTFNTSMSVASYNVCKRTAPHLLVAFGEIFFSRCIHHIKSHTNGAISGKTFDRPMQEAARTFKIVAFPAP
mmetsp:Transcript_1365/g.2484  ORF Transcript_1365/g.2484 Transcript_1365/m.2484 type:complete len:104 (-) Transcript_1365:625-936(-)